MENCVFCKIVAGTIPAYILYEDSDCIAILDASQATPGHSLVMPKKHYSNFLSAPSEVLSHCMVIAQRIGKAIQASNPAIKGMNLLSNCGEIAGQTVNHLHFHLIPRYRADDIQLAWTSHFGAISAETFNTYATQIRNCLQ